MPPGKRTAFVLAGGGNMGAVQVGMIEALYERGIVPDLILGTSIGALNGAYIASRPPIPETAQELGSLWRGLERGDFFPFNPLTGLMGFAGRRESLVSPRRIRKLLEDQIEFDRLEDAPIPLHTMATDIRSGEERRLSEGPAVEAVLASAAIPGVLPPVVWGGRPLVDGSVINNAPIGHAVELGSERVYVLPCGFAQGLDDHRHGALGLAIHAQAIAHSWRLEVEVELLRDRAELFVIPPPHPLDVRPMDFSRTGELIERSAEKSASYLQDATAGTSGMPYWMREPGGGARQPGSIGPDSPS